MKETVSRDTWMANKAMPDSISMNIMDRSFLSPVAPSVCSFELYVPLTPRNTLKILNTTKPVTRAFTIMDRTSAVITITSPQYAATVCSCTIFHEPLLDTKVTTGKQLKSTSERRQL